MSSSESYHYFFKLPLYRYSTKTLEITDQGEQVVGTMRRFYRSVPDRIVDAFLNLANKKNYIATNGIFMRPHKAMVSPAGPLLIQVK